MTETTHPDSDTRPDSGETTDREAKTIPPSKKDRARIRRYIRATRGSHSEQPADETSPLWRVPRPEFHHSYAQLNGHATSQLDSDAVITQVNTVMPRLLGVTPEKLNGQPFTDLISEENAKRIKDVLAKKPFEHPEVVTGIDFTSEKGKKIPVDLTIVPQTNKETDEPEFFVVIREQQESPSTVDDAAAFRATLDNVKDAVIMTDTEGSLLFWNPGAERLFGWKRNEILGQDALKTLFNQDDPHTAREVTNHLRGGGHYHGEGLMQTKNGDLFLAEVHGAPILQHDRTAIGSYVVCRDITQELEKREDAWKKQQAASPVDPALRQKYSQHNRILHEGIQEAKNPLTSLYLQLHLVEKQLPEPRPAPIVRAMDSMKRNLDRVGDMLQKLVDASKLERHSLQLEPNSDYLEEMLLAVKADLLPTARMVDVRIIIDIDPNTRVYGDLDRIAQVMTSLITHSLHHTPPGGYVRATSTTRRDELEIQIDDSGEGLRKEDTERILEPYPQIESEEINDMSLYIAKGIIEAHHGRLRADSPGLGKGTTFTIHLPKHDSVNAVRSNAP